MTGFLTAAHRVLSVANRIALVLAGIGLVAMTAIVAWQVFGRKILNDTPTWTEPASLLLMSWFILLGAAVGTREEEHLGFEIGLHYAPPRLRRIMQAVTYLLVTGFGGAMFWYALQLTRSTWSAKMPALGVPQGMDYLAMVVGGALIALFGLEKLVGLLAGEKLGDAGREEAV